MTSTLLIQKLSRLKNHQVAAITLDLTQSGNKQIMNLSLLTVSKWNYQLFLELFKWCSEFVLKVSMLFTSNQRPTFSLNLSHNSFSWVWHLLSWILWFSGNGALIFQLKLKSLKPLSLLILWLTWWLKWEQFVKNCHQAKWVHLYFCLVMEKNL